MEPDQADRILELVAEALERTPADRPAFLREACGGDDTLRAEVQSLVDREAFAGEFLNTPALAQDGSKLFDPEAGELKPDDTLGDCRIIRLLGEGGMGEVYLAQDTRLERLVAVKLLKSQFDDDALLRRFRHERKVLAALTHPGIARLYGGATTPEGRSYLVMEYVQGERLDRYCEANNLEVTERLTLFRKVCAAVSYAHQNLVVHRDLKPANIRVTPEGEPKLLDFGIAKLLEPEDTSSRLDPTVTMQGAMTPEYASPEQIKGEAITTASDGYSLGVVLFELLTGQRPFAHLKGRRTDELARAICEEEPPRPSTVAGQMTTTAKATSVPATTTRTRSPSTNLRRQLEGDLDNIVSKALRKEPARRYPSVLALSEDLRRHCEGLPVSARKDTLPYRASKFIRRNKAGVAAASLVVVALVTGLVIAAWQAHVADQERDRARQERDRAQTALASEQVARKRTQQINSFLQEILGSADPQKMGKEVKFIEVVNKASETIDRSLANDPDVCATVHWTFGKTYLRLGMLEEAERHFRAAYDTFLRLYGSDNSSALNIERQLSIMLMTRNRYDEAMPLLRHVTDCFRRKPASEPLFQADALSLLGYCLGNARHYPEAEQSLNEALAICESQGENNDMFPAILANLAGVKTQEDDMEAAIGLYQRCVASFRKVSPNSHYMVLNETSLFKCLYEMRRYDEADKLLETMQADCHRIVGESDNYVYTFVMYCVESHDFRDGDFTRIAENGKELINRCTALSGPGDNDTVSSNYFLGASLTRIGHALDGEPFLRTALKNLTREPGLQANFLLHGNAETALGDCLLAQKRYAEAEPLLLTGYADLEKRLGAQNGLTIEATHRLHDLYLAWNKPAEAARFASNAKAESSPTP